jgi:hypothetical protein
MALDHYGLEENYVMDKMLKNGNTIFTTIFTVECAMKLIVRLSVSISFIYKIIIILQQSFFDFIAGNESQILLSVWMECF